MSVEVPVQITMTAVGAGQASAALTQVVSKTNEVQRAHAGMASQFQKRFTHLGLQLFISEAVRASGVSQSTSQIIGLLNLSIMSLSATFLRAAPIIGLVGAALVATIAIASKLRVNLKEKTEQLEKAIAANDKERVSLQESITKLEGYRRELGHLPPMLESIYTAKKKLADFYAKEESRQLTEQITNLRALLIQENQRLGVLRQQFIQQQAVNQMTFFQIAITHGLSDAYRAFVNAFKDLPGKMKEVEKSIAENNLKLQEAILKFKDLGHAGSKGLEEVTARAAKTSAAMRGWITEHKKAVDHSAVLWKKFEGDAKGAVDKMAGTFSNSIASMIVDGKEFGNNLSQIWKDLARDFISAVIQMEIRWLAFQAVTGGGGGFMTNVLGFASGGSVMVDRPTMMMAGEGGEPEIASFTPLSKLGSSADKTGSSNGGTRIEVGVIETHVHGISNPDEIAKVVGMKIVERIKGRGESNFVRA